MVSQNTINNRIRYATTIDFKSIGTVEINSSAGVISIGNDDVDQGINVGTDGERTETFGSTNGASSLALRYGTADFTLASATGTVISALDTGEITMPLQPAFLAVVGSDLANQTGNGATVHIVFDTEIFDQNSDYNNTTGTLTFPVTGRYQLNYDVGLCGNIASTRAHYGFVSSNRTYISYFGYDNSYTSDYEISYLYNALCDMDAGDTVYAYIRCLNGASDGISITGTSAYTSHFSGYLAC